MAKRILTHVSCLASVGIVAALALGACAESASGPTEGESAPAVAAQAVTKAAPVVVRGEVRLADGEERIGGEHVATLPFGRASKLIFIGVGSDRDEAVAVVGSLAPGSLDPSSLPELAKASPLELFNAVAAPGTALPKTLARLYGDAPRLGPQGWLLERASAFEKGNESALIQTGFCNNDSFAEAVNSYEYNDRGSPLFRFDQIPNIDSQGVWDSYSDCFGTSWEGGVCPSFYTYFKPWDDVDGFYGRVAVCDLGFHPALSGNWGSWTHPGPTIQFLSRAPGETTYDLPFTVDVAADQVGHAWRMQGTSVNHDWMLRIKESEANDGFDIATAVEDLLSGLDRRPRPRPCTGPR